MKRWDRAKEPYFERAIVDGLYQAGQHYYDWLIGDRQVAEDVIRENLGRPSSEIFHRHVRVYTIDDEVVAGYVALTGPEFKKGQCQLRDLWALMKCVPEPSQPELKHRLKLLSEVFPAMPTDQFIGSRMWVLPTKRARTTGREILDDIAQCGRRSGFSQVHGYVAENNTSMISLLLSLGWKVAPLRRRWWSEARDTVPNAGVPRYLLGTLQLQRPVSS